LNPQRPSTAVVKKDLESLESIAKKPLKPIGTAQKLQVTNCDVGYWLLLFRGKEDYESIYGKYKNMDLNKLDSE